MHTVLLMHSLFAFANFKGYFRYAKTPISRYPASLSASQRKRYRGERRGPDLVILVSCGLFLFHIARGSTSSSGMAAIVSA